MIFDYLEFVGPTVVALVTVPLMQHLKRLVGSIDKLPDWGKQFVVVTIAFGLTKLGTVFNATLPVDISLFTGTDVEVLVSAAIAFAVHAGKKKAELE